jgi:hypothetical protein
LVSDSIGSAAGCRGIVELPNTIGAGKFMGHVGNAGGVMDVIVCILTVDCLKRWMKFASPFFAGGKINVGKEHKSELGVIDGDPVGVHAPCFRAKKLHVGTDFFAEVEGELDDVEELCKYDGGVGVVGTLHDNDKDILDRSPTTPLPLFNTPATPLQAGNGECVCSF